MKKNLIIILSIFIVGIFNTESKAQLNFGLRAGVSSSSIKMKDLKEKSSDDLLMEAGDASIGMHFGLVGRVSFLKFYVQPEVLFSSTGGEIKVKDIKNGKYKLKEQKFQKIDIPIMLGAKFGPVRLNAGPIASILLDSESKVTDIEGAEEEFKKSTWGFQAGIGFDIWKLILDLKYEGSFSEIGKEQFKIGNNVYKTDSRTSQFVLSLGFLF